VVDPHVHEKTGFGICICNDLSAPSLTGGPSILERGLDNLLEDFKMNLALVLRPLDVAAARSDAHFYTDLACADSNDDDVAECSPAETPPIPTSLLNHSAGAARCDVVVAGTTNDEYVLPRVPSGPCFVSDPMPQIELTMTLEQDDGSELPICTLTLVDARIAGGYNDATIPDRIEGLLRAFLTDANAQKCVVPKNSLLCESPKNLYDILREEEDACGDDADRDVRDGVGGWWFYINYAATRAHWSAP